MDEEFQGIKAMLDGFALMAAQMEAKISVIQAQVEEIDGDFPQQIPVGMDGVGSSAYNSYFRVINDGGNIGVTDGGVDACGVCGTVKINGTPIDVSAISSPQGAGTYYVWLHSWIATTGPDAEIIIGTSTRPNNPNGGLAFASQLLGRVTIDSEGVMVITQDYLRGGEHTEILVGDCEGGAIA